MKINTQITLFLLLFAAVLKAQIVTTVAGVQQVSGHADGTALSATFNNPHGIACDTLGNVYIADRYNHTIRKLDLNGNVTTIAGTPGVTGSQNGVGGAALFNEPWGICSTKEGVLYVADTRNNKIRKIDQNGNVTTYAGTGNFGSSNGNASNATFGNPTGLEIDDAGNLYVADHLTHIIRKISNVGVVSTVAGLANATGSVDGTGNAARFNRPYGLTLDNVGNIIVADEWNHKIRKVTTTGVVTTLAGTGAIGSANGAAASSGFNYPWDVTVDPNGLIYIADGFNYEIRIYNPISSQVEPYVGQTAQSGAVDGTGNAASFSGATALAFNKATGEIFVGDAYNHLIRKITNTQSGISLLVASGSSTVCAGEFIGLAVYPQIYATYNFYKNNQLVQSSSSNVFNTSNTSVGLNTFSAEVSDATGQIYQSTQTITVLDVPQPSITVLGNTTFYEGDSVTFIASQGSNYHWSNGATTATLVVKSAGAYKVSVTNANGCVGVSEVIEVVVNSVSASPEISIVSGSASLCFGDSAVLISTYTSANQWFKDGWPILAETGNTLSVKNTGSYQVQVTLANNQILLSDPIEVTVSTQAISSLSADYTAIEQGKSVSFSAVIDEVASVLWDFGDGTTSAQENPTHTYNAPGAYQVSLTVNTTEGCLETATLSSLITVLKSSDLFIPNTFTPNNDNNNDVFFVQGSDIDKVSIQVFNQWGQLVFERNDNEGWDGLCLSGTPAAIATYTYLIKVTLVGGTQKTFSGHLNLVR